MIRWGILGAGNIARRFAVGLSYDHRSSLFAVACRTKEKAEKFKEKYPCQEAYGSYDDLLENPNIDVVYIALPHLYHYEWSKKALLKGKAVLCEKPAMMNAKQMQDIKRIAQEQGVFFMEAMKTRFTPMYQEIKRMVEAGVIGTLEKVEATMCNEVPYVENNYYYEPKQGGCLLDTGIYALCYIDEYIKQPLTVEKVEYAHHPCGVDIYVHATVSNGSIEGIVECAFDRKKERVATLYGTLGKIIIEELHRPMDIHVELHDGTKQDKHMDYEHDDFYSQIKHVNDCLLTNTLESDTMPLDDSIVCARLLDSIREKMR